MNESQQNVDVKNLSNQELHDVFAKCNKVIAEGTATLDDYELFVLCQKEISERTWS
jgi:hypothetical protein